MAGKITIVEAEEIVEAGELDPNEIHLPGIYVDKVILATDNEKPIERMRVQEKSNKKGGVVKGGRGRIMRRGKGLFFAIIRGTFELKLTLSTFCSGKGV